MDDEINNIKYLSDVKTSQEILDLGLNIYKPNLFISSNSGTSILAYNQRNDFVKTDKIADLRSLINSMVKFNLEQPYADANKRPLTYIEMVQYAIY